MNEFVRPGHKGCLLQWKACVAITCAGSHF